MLVAEFSNIERTVMIIMTVALVIATFADTNIGLIAILLSMLLSPELEAGATQGRSVVLRAEDLLLIIVSLTWLAKMAIRKELPFVRNSPLNAPIGIYIAVLFIATLKAIGMGGVQPVKGMFFVLKMVEYFVLYYIVLNHTTKVKQVKMFLLVFLITAVIVGIYCNLNLGSAARMSAPFEGAGEPNTLGGYLLLVIFILGGLILYYKEKRRILILTLCFLLPPFILTLSRASYLGLIPALFVFSIISKQKKVIIAGGFLFLAFMALILAGPPAIQNRIFDAFKPEKGQTVKQLGPVSLGPSPAARIETWTNVLKYKFPKKPFLGHGVTGLSFIDSQYILMLGETGIIGFLCFCWLMWRVWIVAYRSYHEVETPMFKGIALGFLAGFVGLLFHAIGSNTFIIVRISEPFWFFAAIVVKLKDIETGKAEKEEEYIEFKRPGNWRFEREAE